MHADLTDYDHCGLFARHVRNLTEHPGGELRGLCPFHNDTTPSWTGNRYTGLWKCFGCGAQGNVYQFSERAGEPMPTREIVATYDYRDEHGALLYEVVRFSPKGFAQRRTDGNGGYIWNLNGTRRVLYRLPEVLKAETVCMVEGEKDADRLRSLSFIATCNPGGASKWREEYSQALTGKRVVILPDNDEAGEQHALAVARSLLAVAAAIKLVRLPGLPPKGDVSDWLDAGHSREELTEIVRATPILKPEDLPPEQKFQSKALALTSLKDLLSEPEERVSWLVDKRLPTGGFSLLVAKPKVGKTTLARNLALAVAKGRDFFGRTTQKGPVVYLALEEKRSEVRKHFRDMGATGEEDIYVHTTSAPADALQQIRAVAEEKKPALIIIDPLFKLTRVKDGNDYAQVTQALEPLLTMARETGAHVLCVHHAGKGEREGGGSILGSTAIFATVDTALLMKRTERYRTISSIQRYGEDLPETVLRFDPQTQTVTLGESREREEEKRIAEAILACLKEQEEDQEKGETLTEEQINDKVEGRNAYKRKALRELVEKKEVERLGEGRRGDPFRHALKNSRFLVPTSSGGQGNKRRKNGVSPQEDSPHACSQESDLSADSPQTQGQESCRYCGKPDCRLTRWGWVCRLSQEDRQRWEERQAGAEQPERGKGWEEV